MQLWDLLQLFLMSPPLDTTHEACPPLQAFGPSQESMQRIRDIPHYVRLFE